MSAFILKIIAAATMLADHVGYVLLPKADVLRIIGRLAFPIYAFFIAEGFRYTRNRMKYFLRIFVLGAVCQIVYTVVDKTVYIGILLSFSLAIIMMACVDVLKRAISGDGSPLRKYIKSRSGEIIAAAVINAAVISAAYLLCRYVEVDYGFWGIMVPVLTSVFEDKYPRLAMFSLGLILLCVLEPDKLGVQYYSLLTIPLLLIYNGRPGRVRMKYFFYIFYPLHLVIIYGISLLL